MKKVLIIEDDIDISSLILFNLERSHYQTLQAYDGITGIALAKKELPDLIILDLMLPEINGIGVLKALLKHKATRHIPVIILSARNQTEDRIAGLELGAEDYMNKPFSPKELILRINKILNRTHSASKHNGDLTYGPFRFSQSSLAFFINEEEVSLTLTEFKLMLYLCEHPNTPLRREQILTHVFDYEDKTHSRTLDTHLKRLRKKIGSYAPYIQTIRGTGYVLSLPDTPS